MTQPCLPRLEYLPNEIKLMISHQLPDAASLRALVHASPQYHQVYRSTRNETFTIVTLRTLASRNLGFETPAKHLDIMLYGNEEPSKFLLDTINQVYSHIYAKETICLNVKQCLSLLCIKHAVRYVDFRALLPSIWLYSHDPF